MSSPADIISAESIPKNRPKDNERYRPRWTSHILSTVWTCAVTSESLTSLFPPPPPPPLVPLSHSYSLPPCLMHAHLHYSMVRFILATSMALV